jgi:2-dehydropantoate 2-reductase
MRAVREAERGRPAVGIVGAGAMGTLFAYLLAARCDVAVLDVRSDVVERIARDGVRLGDLPARAVEATTDPARLYDRAVMFVFVRATDSLAALRPFAGKLDPAMPIVSLQNGLGNEEAIKAALGGSVPLVLGVTSEGAVSLDRGHAARLGAGTTVLGSGGASREISQWVAVLLRANGIDTSVAYDIRPQLWGKLIANAAINPLAALLDVPNGAIPREPQAALLARSIAQEAASVAQALRINLPFRDPWEYVKAVIAAAPEARNSMALDLRAGRRSEVEYINGAVVASGRRASVATPYNQAMVRLILARERVQQAAMRGDADYTLAL